MNSVILIPARYQSSRYPGKPLVDLKGASGTAKPLIQRSVEAARRVPGVSGVFVVTDDERGLQAEEAADRVGGTTVVTDAGGYALYFSKRLIPHLPAGALEQAMSP